MKTAILLTYLIVTLTGLSMQDDSIPKGFDTTDLKSSMSAILGNEAVLIAKARKAKDPMV